MYANRVKGQTKVLKRREEKEYEYKFTLIHNNSEDGYDHTNFVMSTDHWEYTDKKSHVTMVIETYATAHGVPALSPSVRQAIKRLKRW